MTAWEWIVHYAKALMNQPWFIAVTTIAEAALFALIFISKTSFGKRAIAYLKAKAEESAAKNEATVRKVEEYIRESKAEYEALKAELAARAEAAAKELLEAEGAIYEALSNINNVKVRKAVEEWKAAKDEKAKGLAEAYAIADGRYETIREDAEKLLAELKEEIEECEERMKRIEGGQ